MNIVISNLVLQFEQIYMVLNEHYYQSKLPSVKFFVAKLNRNKYNYFSLSGNNFMGYKMSTDMIKISDTTPNIIAGLLHEMAHLYDLENGIKDSSGTNNAYHNKRFKETAESHGLIIEHSTRYGWIITRPSLELLDFIDLQGWQIIQIQGYGKPLKTSTHIRKYICPCCKNSVRASKAVNILCGDCMKKMEPDPKE